ncbi:E3 ubiquitin-protein ligase MARCHF11-like [Branchiostoma floridae]|uniref:RING-type E3 ubiquitin transferase n=1 Tax=Branchiostoma floridae TaxID=7739 RepID=A0A9J7NBK1_BRAFL|nr:E3 ubiquitin-protein ligase MARCHF11-like [Branchiostoma floridae]
MSGLEDEEKSHLKVRCSCVSNEEDIDDASECLSSQDLRNGLRTISKEVRKVLSCPAISPRKEECCKKPCSSNCLSDESATGKEDTNAESPEPTEEVQGDLQVVQSHASIMCQSRARSRQDSESTASSYRFMCRICHGGEDEEDAMISPCLCSGSLQYCHQECLLKWLGWKSTWTCELCSHGFSIVNYGLKRPSRWKCVKLDATERWSMVVVLLALSAIIGSTYFLVWSFTNPMSEQQKKSPEFQVCYALYAILNLFSVGIVLFYVRPIAALVNRWRAINQRLQVQDYAGRLKKRRLSECSSILVLPSTEVLTSSVQLVLMDNVSNESRV